MTTTQHDDPRALIRYALVGFAFMVALAWTLFLVRETLLLIYVAALVAIGLSPIVSWIQRHNWTPRNMPRWSAALSNFANRSVHSGLSEPSRLNALIRAPSLLP